MIKLVEVFDVEGPGRNYDFSRFTSHLEALTCANEWLEEAVDKMAVGDLVSITVTMRRVPEDEVENEVKP